MFGKEVYFLIYLLKRGCEPCSLTSASMWHASSSSDTECVCFHLCTKKLDYEELVI